jgi:hypothetical protein
MAKSHKGHLRPFPALKIYVRSALKRPFCKGLDAVVPSYLPLPPHTHPPSHLRRPHPRPMLRHTLAVQLHRYRAQRRRPVLPGGGAERPIFLQMFFQRSPDARIETILRSPLKVKAAAILMTTIVQRAYPD